MSQGNLSRRTFLLLSAASTAAALVAACGGGAAGPSGAAETAAEATAAPAAEAGGAAASAGGYKEAPMLADLVAAGELPAIDERLPVTPRVVKVNSEIGEYGGTWRRAYKGLSDRWGPTKLHEEMAIEWDAPDPDTINVTANYVEKWEQNESARR